MAASPVYRQRQFRRPAGACDLIVVRHGESAAATAGQTFPRRGVHSDPGLHPDGHQQAARVCDRVRGDERDIAAVYVTTLQRTHQTAAPLLEALGIEPVIEPDLREVFLGDFEGAEHRRRAAADDPVLRQAWEQQRWDVIPGAEPDEDFTVRVRRGVARIGAAHRDQTVVVFTHAGVISKIFALATGARGFAFAGTDNAAISRLVLIPGAWIVRSWNDTAHLSPCAPSR